MQQQIWGEVVVLTQASSTDSFEFNSENNLKFHLLEQTEERSH